MFLAGFNFQFVYRLENRKIRRELEVPRQTTRPNKVACPICDLQMADKKCVKRHVASKHKTADINEYNIESSGKCCR